MCEVVHLKSSDFQRMLRKLVPREELMAAHLHLLTCRSCLDAFLTHDEALTGLYLDDMYGAGTARALRREVKQPFNMLGAAIRASQDVHDLPVAELGIRMMNTNRVDDLILPCVVIEKARDLWGDSPEEAEFLLTGVINTLKRRLCDASFPVVCLLLVHALAYRANVYRILDRFDEAEQDLAEAGRLLRVLDAEDSFRGEVQYIKGFLLTAQRKFTAAIPKLEEASRLLPDRGPSTRLQATITLANAYREAARVGESIRTLQLLLEKQPPSAFPDHSYLATLQSLATSYALAGRAVEARDLLPRIQELAKKEDKRLNLTRVKWLEALIFKAEGKRTPAAMCFREVQSDFLAANLAMDAALAGLTQAAMYLEHDDTRAAAELAEELIPVFRSKGIHREAWAASRIVLEALRREAATLAQVEELVDRLRGLPTRRVAR